MHGSAVDLAREVQRRATNDWAQAAVVVALAALWLCPLVVCGLALWDEGTPRAVVVGALGMVTGLFALLLPAGYYRSRPWERSGRVYEGLGVRWFKRWVPDGDRVAWHIRQALPDYRLIASRADLSSFERWTRRAEQAHLVMLAVGA